MSSLRQHYKLRRSAYWQLAVIYILSAMGAYQISSIPFQWIGSALAVIFVLVSLLVNQRYPRVHLYPVLLILFVFVLSIAGWLMWSQTIDFQHLIPTGASTPYPVFVFLRYFQFIAFIAVYLVSIKFLKQYGLQGLARMTTVCGVLVSAYALYVYVAQIIGLPEIPRSRMGTGGEDQAVTFTYAFHRAMGTFREPSHLAQWLILPLFMTLIGRSHWYIAARVLIVSALLITGSLTGIVAISVGYIVSIFMVLPIRKALVELLAFAGILALATAIFMVLAAPNPGGSIDFWRVIMDRLSPIVFGGGLLDSNRAYVYEFIAQHPAPIIGYGLGNGNIMFSDSQGNGLMGSFLSFPVNMLYSVGYIGAAVIVIFLLAPLVALFRFSTGNLHHIHALVAAYIGWLVVYSVLSEELSVSFAILYAACVHYYLSQKLKRGHTNGNALANNPINLAHNPSQVRMSH